MAQRAGFKSCGIAKQGKAQHRRHEQNKCSRNTAAQESIFTALTSGMPWRFFDFLQNSFPHAMENPEHTNLNFPVFGRQTLQRDIAHSSTDKYGRTVQIKRQRALMTEVLLAVSSSVCVSLN